MAWIRAVGVAGPLGGWAATRAALRAGTVAIAPITHFDATGYPCTVAAGCGFPLAHQDPRATLLEDAWRDLHVDGNDDGWRAEVTQAPTRVGVFMGAETGMARFRHGFALATAVRARGVAGYDAAAVAVATEAAPGLSESRTSAAAPSRQLAALVGARGPLRSFAFACASSALAVAEGARALALGLCDVAVCGGVGADVDPMWLTGFGRLGALSTRGQCAPFAHGRDGFVIGEGAVLVVLANARGGASVRVAGSGRALDSDSLTSPNPSASGARRAIRQALAGLDGDRVRYVETHGTGTELNDRTEALAVREVLGPGQRDGGIGAIKANLGHWLAGAGALGVVHAAAVLADGAAAPLAHDRPLDPECGLPFAWGARWRKRAGDVAVVNAFGFGGANVSVALEVVA